MSDERPEKPKWVSPYKKVTWWSRIKDRVYDLVRCPDPYDLGRSDSNCLQSEDFMDRDDIGTVYTWEDWRREVKKDYPVRYFISHTLYYSVWSPVARRVNDAIYWVKCHTLRKYRYHLLDLRGVHPTETYTHGWMDRSCVILWASFKALCDFVEKEKPYDFKDATPEELEDPQMQRQKANYDEMMILYHWWKVGQVEEQAEVDRLFDVYKQLEKDLSVSKEEIQAAKTVWFDATMKVDARADEMLARLVKIRNYLWT